MSGSADQTLAPARPLPASSVAVLIGRDGLLVVLVCGFAALLVGWLDRLISTGGWLALVAGRLIAERGLPSQNALTLIGHGRDWVDQQWLAQLALYGLERSGGLRLMLLAHVVCVVAAFAAAAVIARRRGGSPAAVAAVAVVCLVPYALTTHSVRTQTLVYPAFAALAAILTAGAPLRRGRLVALGALLVLWANVHGSVLVAAALVSLRGVVNLHAARGRSPTGWLLALAPWPAVFASPYAAELPAYYADTVFNGSFGDYLAQWQPTSLSVVSAPVFVLAFACVWVVGRDSSAYSTYEKLAGCLLLVLALLAVRHWVWFALFALAMLPPALAAGSKPVQAGVARLNFGLACGATALLALVAATTVAKPAGWFERSFPEAGAAAVAAYAREHPRATVYATERYADWLLWKLPWLEGRLAYDSRFELLEDDELRQITLFRASPAFLDETLESYDVLVLDPVSERRVVAAWSDSTRPLYRDRRLAVAVRAEARGAP